MIKQINMNRVLPNMTGRRFMCVSRNSDYVDNFDDNFTIGKIYAEALVDMDKQNDAKKEYNELLLISDNEIPIYIEQDDFVEVEGINSIVLNSWIYLN